MALPNVVQYSLAAANNTNIVSAQGVMAVGSTFTLATTILDVQRRLTFTMAGNESANTFKIIGLNQAGNTISEVLAGVNTGSTSSNLDYKTLISIQAIGSTAATLSIGTNSTGSCLWQIMNYQITPVNIECSVVAQTGSANFSVQYTYDDPNNLPLNVGYPQPFTLAAINGTTTSIDGSINDPVAAVRLLINSGTGIMRATFIQAGIGSP
jgi:hypothetical protein